ncbi:MAG: hypothetical protein R3250_04045 [Melioribacteraceae bacterium]|nr:hypothetical protein [Melioribacteraceae bacterium]
MKYKEGDTINDPSLVCSDCKEVSGGSVQKIEGQLLVIAHCGCPLMLLMDYEK